MVDMRVEVILQALDDEIDEALESSLLILPRQCPVRHIGNRAMGFSIRVAEQILEPAVADEWIALQVKENIAC